MIKIGIIGTGGMANAHAERYRKIKGVRVVAACDIDAQRVRTFCDHHEIPRGYTETEAFLAHPGLDAVANVTPDRFHAPISLQAIRAGKHILCEKPLAENFGDARRMARAARRKGIIHMVNFSYRRSAAVEQASRQIARGSLGRIIHFEARYYQSWLSTHCWGNWKTTPAWLWRQSTAHGSKGVLGDIGVHIVDLATFPIGSPVQCVNCQLKTFNDIKGNKQDSYVLDANDTAIIRCELANGALGTIQTTRWAAGYVNSLQLEIFGEKGGIRINLDHDYNSYEICSGRDLKANRWKRVSCKPVPDVMQRFITSIRTGKNAQPDFDRGAEIQQILDTCFDSDRTGKTMRVKKR